MEIEVLMSLCKIDSLVFGEPEINSILFTVETVVSHFAFWKVLIFLVDNPFLVFVFTERTTVDG